MSLGVLPGLRQLRGDVLIRFDDRRGAMPGMALGSNRGIGCRREGRMYAPSLDGGRAVIDSRADQWVPKCDVRTKDQQAAGFGGSNCLAVDPD